MLPSRREILKATLVACGPAVPVFLARSAACLAGQAEAQRRHGRILVVVQLDGGNDGLNTVVPFQDDNYRRLRPRLALPTRNLHRLNDDLGLHPDLTELRRLHEDRQLAIIQGVGYPNPNRSHFESMAIWNTARPNPDRATPGWLARAIDLRFDATGDAPALHLGDSPVSQALTGGRRQIPSIASLEQFRRRLGMPDGPAAREQRAALDQLASQETGKDGALLQFVQRTHTVTYASSARLEDVVRAGGQSTSRYPDYGLARRLKSIAQLIKAGLQTPIYYTQLGGFDTHASQIYAHASLLREVAASLKAFLSDLEQARELSRVVVLVFSEFGRRVAENASGGTDHGSAAPVFLLGPRVNPGIHGTPPNLTNLIDGDPVHDIDFRRIYATLLDQWLDCPSEAILGQRFAPLDLLQRV
jgi:uncharacterized protein (DUF1501 family)